MSTAFKPADILIPKKENDMEKWAVVACDQYTSEPDYWKSVENIVGNAKSAFRIILPEIYLEQDGMDERIESINRTMSDYISENIFDEYKDSFVYVERIQSNGKVRCGLVGAIDLEMYNYEKGSKSQVRATEATVAERIPPRVKIREKAELELPHIMILIDDVQKTVIEPLSAKTDGFEKVYDFTLMQDGGKLRGYIVDQQSKQAVLNALDALSDKAGFNAKYGLENEEVLLYAMGDGNHSLATAKECYERLKKANPDKDLSDSPARYALVEIVNLHSEALEFEAIHRIVTGVDPEMLLENMTSALQLNKNPHGGQSFEAVINGQHYKYYIGAATSNLTVGSVQSFLDEYLAENGGKIDYIHGSSVIDELSMQESAIGFILPDMDKSELFPTVIKDGALPRKTFSMGHACDKRFYVECRKIK